MSAGWRITRGEQQFAAKDVAELKLLGVGGKIQPGDLVQEPGGTAWRYAIEVPELDGLIKPVDIDEADIPIRSGGGGAALRGLLIGWGLVVVLVGFGGLAWMWMTPPELLVADKAVATSKTALSSVPGMETPDGASVEKFSMLEIVGVQDKSFQVVTADGQRGWLSSDAVAPVVMGPLEGMATEYSNLLAQPDSNASKVGEVKLNEVVELLEKKGDFYQVNTASGTGWLGTSQVLPGYMFSQVLKERYDPKFNPNAYVQLANYSWTPSGEPDQPETMTNMMFHLVNPTPYGMSGVVLRITFFDGDDREIATQDFEVPRLLPPSESEFDMGGLHLDGIDIDIAWDENTRAEVKVDGAVALSAADYSRLKAEEEARLAAEAEEAEAK
ncbi:MAG: hypothetical protein CMP23_03840 [Rickettsiales bacterium]|nr:hypothetical protein [Rickettsiales bacterium]